jgi:hypothetical protein
MSPEIADALLVEERLHSAGDHTTTLPHKWKPKSALLGEN